MKTRINKTNVLNGFKVLAAAVVLQALISTSPTTANVAIGQTVVSQQTGQG